MKVDTTPPMLTACRCGRVRLQLHKSCVSGIRLSSCCTTSADMIQSTVLSCRIQDRSQASLSKVHHVRLKPCVDKALRILTAGSLCGKIWDFSEFHNVYGFARGSNRHPHVSIFWALSLATLSWQRLVVYINCKIVDCTAFGTRDLVAFARCLVAFVACDSSDGRGVGPAI